MTGIESVPHDREPPGVQFGVRLSLPGKVALAAMARADRRSMSQTARLILEAELTRRGFLKTTGAEPAENERTK